MSEDIRGIMPAIASPCDEKDRFLEEEFATLAESLYADRIHGLYVCGWTGEGYNMRLEERKRAAEIAVEVSRKHNGKVIVHVGASNTRDAAELAEHAAGVGVHAISSMPPPNRDQTQLVSYYSEVASAGQLPFLVYHMPLLTGYEFSVDEMLAFLDIERVIGFKISDWNLFFMNRVLIARPDSVIFNGTDEFLFVGLLYGAVGGIGTNYNLFPQLFLRIYDAVSEGHLDRAMDLQKLFLAYADVFWRYGGIRPNFEDLMRERGLPCRCWRHPRSERDQQTSQRFLAEVRPKLETIEQAIAR